MKPTKEQMRQYCAQALERCLTSFARLDESEWKKKATDRWTAKDHLAHLAVAQEEEANLLIKQALAGERGHLDGFGQREQINDFNDRTLTTVRDLPASELLGRLKAAFEENLRLLDGASEADLDKPANSPGWDCPGSVRDLFFSSYLHLPGHYQDIRRVAKKKLPHWAEASTPEEVNYRLERTFHYMPLIFWSSRAGDLQATYLFTMEGRGGGQWSIHISDGKAQTSCGAPEKFDMEFRTKPELWMDLSSNDLNPMWAITTRKVHLGGNAGLAMKLGSLFQVSE